MIKAERKYMKLKCLFWYIVDLHNKYCTGMTFFQYVHLKFVENIYARKYKQYKKLVKPCYQCGDLARIVNISLSLDEKTIEYSVECEICAERTILCNTKREALKKWNSGDEHFRVIGK